MRVSECFIPTRKEIPKEAEIRSHQMMLRSGMIRQHVAGVYSLLPLGWRVIRKIMDIVREEMDDIGCQEFYLPVLSSSEIWSKSGRWDAFGDDMFRLQDRRGRDMCLAPTHEEVFTEIASQDIRSYRDMPQMWYQIQTKFRDEVRPRSGLIRVRQFFMKDAYSFDADADGLDRSYALQREAYVRIFKRCGIDAVIVKASSGAMGGRDCEEFMVFSEAGDDEIVHCPACGYAANQEVAESQAEKVTGEQSSLEKIHTPNQRTIEEVSAFLGIDSSRLVKSLVYVPESDDKPMFVLVRGDHQVDESKLEAAIGPCRPAEPEEVRALTGADVGFVSAVNIEGARILADTILEGTTGLVSGANENDYHLTGIEMTRDINVERYLPLRTVLEGEKCVMCGEPLKLSRTIEVGHIFKLGTRYSEALGALYLDENGESKPIVMGSYGIGIERIMACIIESNYNEDAMVWPREIAPYLVEVLPLNVTVSSVSEHAHDLYRSLVDHGVSTMLDDRDDRAGVKFKDADLFGAPILVVIGERGLKEGTVEVRVRDTGQTEKVRIENLKDHVFSALNITV